MKRSIILSLIKCVHIFKRSHTNYEKWKYFKIEENTVERVSLIVSKKNQWKVIAENIHNSFMMFYKFLRQYAIF